MALRRLLLAPTPHSLLVSAILAAAVTFGYERRALALGAPQVLALRHGIAMMPIGTPSLLHKRGTAE